MKKGISFLLLSLAFSWTAAAAPSFESSFGTANFAGEGHHVGFARFHPVPGKGDVQNEISADFRFTDFSVHPFVRAAGHHHGANLHAEEVTLCLADLQAFLASQHIESFSLKDLKSWISQLPLHTIRNLEACLEQQIIDYGAIAKDETDWTPGDGANVSTVADGSTTAVPEPSTVHTFIYGLGLLGGVLLRLRASR